METYPETMNDGKVNRDFGIRVHSIEVRVGLFIIHPVGSINTNTSPILQKEMQRIIESRPEIDKISSIVDLREFPNTVVLAFYPAGYSLQPETVSEVSVVFHTFAIEAVK
jgi:hypothetical protein